MFKVILTIVAIAGLGILTQLRAPVGNSQEPNAKPDVAPGKSQPEPEPKAKPLPKDLEKVGQEGKAEKKDDFFEKCREQNYALMRVRQSNPVTVNNAKFVLAAQAEWKPGLPEVHPSPAIVVAPIEIQTQITNASCAEMLFPTCDTFGIKLLNKEGSELPWRSQRSKKIESGPISLAAGATFTLVRRAELRTADEKKQTCELFYYDGTGTETVIGPFPRGAYKLVFWYQAPAIGGAKPNPGEIATWSGQAVLEVEINLLPGTTRRDYAAVNTRSPGKQIRRITESKPGTKNGLQVVMVAETHWKPGAEDVPLEIQLRLTNLGKEEMSFHTGHTGLRMKDNDGKRIFPKAGGFSTDSRPLLLPPGASYSIRRWAVLHWNPEKKAAELYYWRGVVGPAYFVAVFGPLAQGRLRMDFAFYVDEESVWGPKGLPRPERKAGEPATWMGLVESGELVVEVERR